MRRIGFSLLAFVFFLQVAQAETYCEYYQRMEPDLYPGYCGGGKKVKTAGANSTFTDEFNISAATLPTEPSSYGLETLLTGIRGGNGAISPTFALIKGFHRFGTGISTGSNNTFYGDDVVERLSGPSNVTSLSPSEPAKGYVSDLNVGGSFDVLDFGRGGSLKLGASIRYNEITNTVGGGPALMTSYGPFSVGAGFTDEKISNKLSRVLFQNYFFGVRAWIFEFEYTIIKDNVTPTLKPIGILTLTTTLNRFLITAAMRHLDYLDEGKVTQYHFGIQFLVSKHFSIGYLYNYIPGANTIGLQIYL